jgi:L-ribulose-5-phosphate 3-epimerase UlaE
MNSRFGIIQGRLTKLPRKSLLQYFPVNWIEEINIAKTFKFGFIEFLKDRNFNPISPFFTKKGFEIVKDILNLKTFESYSFCDDFFIKKNILTFDSLKKYFIDMSLNLSAIKVKLYVLPLYEKSNLDEKNLLKFKKKIQLISNILNKKNIILALETNLDIESLDFLFKKIKSRNVYLAYNIGNRLKNNICQYQEILRLKNKIAHIHINDVNFSGENVVIGKGNVDFMKIFSALKKINFKKNFTFESNGGLFPIKTMATNIKYIKQITGLIKYKIT